MMLGFRRYRPRRAEIRRNRPDVGRFWQSITSPQVLAALTVAISFWLLASSTATLREQVVPLRPGQYAHREILSRVRFESRDVEWEQKLQQAARDAAPRVYLRRDLALADVEKKLLSLPELLAARSAAGSTEATAGLDPAGAAALRAVKPPEYAQSVRTLIQALAEARDQGKLVVLTHDDREQDLQAPQRTAARIQGPGPGAQFSVIELQRIFARRKGVPPTDPQRAEMLKIVAPLADRAFGSPLATPIARCAVDALEPTHELSLELTTAEQEVAARSASLAPARRDVLEKTVLVRKGTIVTQPLWKLMADEQRAFVAQMPMWQWFSRHLGMSFVVALVTAWMAAYTAAYQPRIVRNPARAVAVASLLLAMLLVAQLAGIGSGSLLIFGIAPSILVAMILCIVYDERYAIGIGGLHAALVALALDQGIAFFFTAALGVIACCYLLDDVRTRSKPIEVGAAAALAMIAGVIATGLLNGDPAAVIGQASLHVGAAGLGVGFVVLGILPFIERTFRITTSMSLLELADVSQPLLRRLSIEAPGTYSHSLQVATLAEAAAEAIAADALLCRVGALYHDIGKMNKADYFCENQFDGNNRHLNLNPHVSLLIILGHVKDGIELAKEYNLPGVLLPIIQQHHGTMLVEYFYHQACKQRKPGDAAAAPISDAQFRYPGPRPRSREVAIVMIADAVEGATRAMVEPTASRIETLVRELILKRLLDGQFNDSDLSFAELQAIERALVKMLLGVYHGRLAYPSTAAVTHGPAATTVKTA